MAWVRQSDDFYDHPKLIEVGPLGIALFFGVIAFCNRNLTDGFIRVSKARTVLDFDGMHLPIVDTGGVLEVDGDALPDGLVAAMIENGLWHQPGHACDACHARADGGEPKRGHVLVHDYFDFQASKETFRMTVHHVKVQPRWFDRIRLNEKTSEVRWAGDRDYQAGDEIRFARTDDELGKAHGFQTRVITHVLSAQFVDGLADGWVVLSLRDPRVELLQDRLETANRKLRAER